METRPHIVWDEYREYPREEMQRRAKEFYDELRRRRSVRHFSSRPVPRDVIEHCLQAAGTAPSGANMQPWSFVVVENQGVKHQIREAAEEVEMAFYIEHAPQEWLDALAPLDTNAHKPFLEIAPWLIVVFAQKYGRAAHGEIIKHYFVQESVGIATGFLITALHHAGLACLTYTPSPMRFLGEILHRPEHERPFLLLAVGYPIEHVTVPDIQKKNLSEIATFV